MKTFINTEEAAELVGCSASTVRNYQKRGDFVPVYKLSSKKVVYRRDDVVVWMQSKLTSVTQNAQLA